MKKIYKIPQITTIEYQQQLLYSGSSDERMKKVCNSFCKHWHFCQDREDGKYCYDKEY